MGEKGRFDPQTALRTDLTPNCIKDRFDPQTAFAE